MPGLVTSSGAWAAAPALSPDGREVAFTRGFDVWVVPLDRSAEPELYAEVADLQASPGASNWSIGAQSIAWSPDGERLAVAISRIGGSGINRVAVAAAGAEPETVFEDPSYWYHPEWLDMSTLSVYRSLGSLTTVDADDGAEAAHHLDGLALSGPGLAVSLGTAGERWIAGPILEERPIVAGTPGAFVEVVHGTWPEPSPDGEWFAYWSGDTLRVARVDGSDDRTIVDASRLGGRDHHFTACALDGEQPASCSHRVPALSWELTAR